MKKFMTIVCATALLGMVACNKDKDEGGNGGNSQTETVTGEGIYRPAVKIDRINHSDSTADEVWVWDGDRVDEITSDSEEGNVSFTYDSEDRVQSITSYISGTQLGFAFGYDPQKYISGVNVNAMNIDMASAVTTHNAQNKLSHISLTVNEELLNMLLSLLPTIMGDSTGNLPFSFLTAAPASKFTVDDQAADIDFVWTGENVSRMIISGRLNFTTTLNEMPTELLQTMAGDYADMIDIAINVLNLGDTPIPVQVTVSDTVDYTYDNQKNPLKGFLGHVDIAALSANNLLTVSGHGNANLSASLSLGALGALPFNYDYPLNDLGSASLSYTYTSDGYPHVVTDADGNTTTYTYKQ